MNFPEFFVDTAPIVPTFYDELGIAMEGPLTGGSSSSTGHGDDQATLDFPDSGLDSSFTLGTGNPYAPFDGPFFSRDPLLTQPSWDTDGQFDPGNSALPASSQSPGTGDAASASTVSQTAQHTERRFAVNITNGQERIGEQVHQPLFASSEGISTTKVEIPMSLPHTEDNINTSTASSSPARRGAKQRGSATSSNSRKVMKAKKAKKVKTTETTEKKKRTKSSAATSAAQGTRKVKYYCIHPGCSTTFFDRPTMHRHVLTKHLKIRPPCPGCHKAFSRDDSLKRHLDTRPKDSNCRSAAKDDGWEEVGNNGKMRLSTRGHRKRVQLITAVYGTS